MLATLALIVALCSLATAALVASRAALQRRRKWRRVLVGPDAAYARVGHVVPVGKRGKAVRIAAVDAGAGAVEVEPFTPPSAAKRGATAEERAMLLAFGYDPKTHDLAPVLQPWRGVQVLKDGERVRFYTERQVKRQLSEPGAWKRALREARA